jgi:fructan beta-fructosidase
MRPIKPLQTRIGRALACLAIVGIPAIVSAEPDRVFADFEQPTYGDWEVTGDAFGKGPAAGALPGQMTVSGFAGKQLVNSFTGGDGSTGKLTSPEFEIAHDFISFLMGGGGHEEKTCMNLVVDGQVVLTATGPNTESGGSEALALAAWNVKQYRGKKARLEIVDAAKGGWGHINVDQIVFTDTRPAGAARQNVTKEITVTQPYLQFPVKGKATSRRVAILLDGKPIREFDIELADKDVEHWMPADLSGYLGKQVTVRVNSLPGDSQALEKLQQTKEFAIGEHELYAEPLRPQFHFSSRRGWLNDPNGMVFHNGEYHLYYQHNPYGTEWGNMHWGHAVSRDLVHWKELPIGLYPHKYGDMAFSGSAVVDHKNVSGFGKDGKPPIVGAYTSTGRGECIIYSNDDGLTWQEYEGNPVVKHVGRDPRLLWHEASKQWVMLLYAEAEEKRWFTFYTSQNLKGWKYESRIEGFFECPDLVELQVDDTGDKHWVLYGADGQYLIGNFDGRVFTPNTKMLAGPPGGAFYAAQTFTNVPDGRHIQIGWGRIPSPGMPFNQMMCFPTELSLTEVNRELRMAWRPVKELEKLHGRTRSVENVALGDSRNALEGMGGELLRIKVAFTPGEAERVTLNARGTPIVFDRASGELSCGKARWKLASRERVQLDVLVDRTSLEIFADNGSAYLVVGAIPPADNKEISLTATGDGARLESAQVIQLKSAWRK